MNSIFFLAASAAEGGGPLDAVTKTFGWNPQMFFSQVVAFVIVALVLKKFAYQPVLDMLDERKKRIAESLENAEKIKAELARTEAARQEILGKANADATKFIEEARAAAAKVLEVESQKAIATANQIIVKAREANDAELARMKAELRREMGRLVVETTGKVAGKVLTLEDQQRLTEETNRQLAA
ncbi:MAG: F0F1 ATP synthase subunit B [Verrucomicrobia bacterium]|nr:F0F1 ATP synthase subunit B [Verrucomicrobiota bacterium]